MKRIFLLAILSAIVFQSKADHVTGLTGFYQHGQVFLTWNNIADTTAWYKCYRSKFKIKDPGDIAAAEYLGLTSSYSSLNTNMSVIDSVPTYYIIQPGGAPLNGDLGLFVATTVENDDFFYAITTVVNGVEDTTLVLLENSLKQAITETIEFTEPILQEVRIQDNNKPVDIYADFISSRDTLNGPLRLQKAGWLGYAFGVYKHDAVSPKPLVIRFHAGGKDFLNGLSSTKEDEINLRFEDFFPDSTEHSSWIGTNEIYDVWDVAQTPLPDSGVNYFYTWKRLYHETLWTIRNYPVDSNRIYTEGTSFGAYGAFFFAMAYPELITGSDLTVGMFDAGFETDFDTLTSMNTGQKNREDGNLKFGTPQSNLPSDQGYNTFDVLNAGWVIHQDPMRDWPVIYSINGRSDEALGWTEKTIWYDSVNNNHFGGLWFWDDREHNGNGKAWTIDNFDKFKFRTNVTYPAISNCTSNKDYGDGHNDDGDIVGSVNGFVDWDTTYIVDDTVNWAMELHLRDLKLTNTTYQYTPDSCTLDVTPRRVQHFKPEPGDEMEWTLTHQNQIIQSGNFVFGGGLLTISGLKVFKDSVWFEIHIALDTFYLDADGDGYGSPLIYALAKTQPLGYVTNDDDCNDSDYTVHIGSPEVCNGFDDDCDGVPDDGLTYLTYYHDADNDNYGFSGSTISTCDGPPAGYVSNSTDCDDNSNAVNPGAVEICNGIDDNCVGGTDEGWPFTTYYYDGDGDNYGIASNTVSTCNGAPAGYAINSGDCVDSNSDINPGEAEVCNGLDDDCSNFADDGLVFITYYQDVDGDNYGNISSTVSTCSGAPNGYVSNFTDCNDADSDINPGEAEVCNNADDNCDNQNDEGLPILIYYADSDVDQFGNPDDSVSTCSITAPLGYVANNSDCDDNNPLVNPDATEIQNGFDDDCDGYTDEFGDGINETENNSSLLVFPNPAKDIVMIELQLNSSASFSAVVTFTNVLGETILSFPADCTTGKMSKSVNLDDTFVDGLYLIKVQSDDFHFTKPLLIHR